MKRILAMLCVIACLFALAVPAMAADTITVSVKAPWSQVNLYVWENDPMEAWPGTAMTKGADGWWTLEIPVGTYTNVIANDGTAQTADLKMDGSADCWVVAEAGAGAVYTDAACTNLFSGGASNPNPNPGTPSAGVDLSGLSSLVLVGGGIPGLKDWTPGDSAGNMTKVSNGVYTKVIAVTAGTSMEIKAAGNGEWNDAYNFGPAENGTAIVLGTKMEMVNGGGAQNFALSVSKDCNLKFTVDLTGATPTMLVEETTEAADQVPENPGTPVVPGGPTVTVYAKVPSSWSDVRVWAWDDSQNNASPSWPGDLVMTKGDDGWYSVEVPVGFNNLLINANNGANQTQDVLGALSDKPIYLDCVSDPADKPVPVVHSEKVDVQEPDPDDIPDPTAPSRPLIPPTVEPGADNNAAPAGSDNTVLLCIIGSVVIIAVAAVLIVVLKKKK